MVTCEIWFKRGIFTPPSMIMTNPVKTRLAGEAIVVMMAELTTRLSGLSEEERQRILDEYAPLMAMLHSKHLEALAERVLEC
jgi:hypothetical protein